MIRYAFEREPTRGQVLRGDVRMPDTPPPRSAVVVAHGFKGFKDWAFFPYLAERLAAAGHAVVTFNFSGSGVIGAVDDVTDLEAFARNTLSAELDELGRVVEMVRGGDLLPRPPRRMGVVGHSRGGATAILHAGGGGVDALVTWSAVASFDRWSEETRREWRECGRIYVLNTRTGRQLPVDVALLDDFEQNRDRLDVRRSASQVRAPWLIVHGSDDHSVAAEEARILAREAPDARLLLIDGAGHTFEVKHPLGEPSPQLEEAVDATLKHFARHLLGQ